MIRQSPLPESDRFNTNHPNLCPALRWKAQFILAEPDPTVPQSNEGLFWCIHTQTCIGPDGKVGRTGQLLVSPPKMSWHGTLWIGNRRLTACVPHWELYCLLNGTPSPSLFAQNLENK